MRSLNKQNDDLDDEIFKMHIALLKLGDPGEAPFPRTKLIKDAWVVEGHEGVGEPGIEFQCDPQHAVQVLNCNGGDTLTPIVISGSAKRLEVENCRHVRIIAEAVLFGITVTNCQDVLIVAGGEVPDVEVESSTAVAFLICHRMIDGKFRCINSGGIMVSTVDRGDNPVMLPEHILAAEHLVSAEVPAYFVTTSSYRTWTSQVTAHPAIE